MNPSQSLARPLLASMFVVGGIDSIRNSESKVKVAEVVTNPLSQAFPIMPSDTETLVKVNGAVQVGAGLLMATGKMPRLAALALIGSIVPTTYAGHRFWEETDDDRRKQQLIHFCKNLGLLGGLLLELDSRPKKRHGSKKRRGSKKVVGRAKRLEGRAKRLEIRAERRAKQAATEASKFALRTAAEVAKSSKTAAKGSKRAAKHTQDLAVQFAPIAGQYAQQYAQSATNYAQSASDHAGQLVSYAQDHLNSLKAA
jgi:uncharacterized membrane protein YphA (DoxX/SURF4 family)